MKALHEQAELKVHTVKEIPLTGFTFKTSFEHLTNFYHYEIFIRVPADHNQPGATYAEFEGQRLFKVASTGGFKTSGLAFQNMVIRIGELAAMVRR